MSAEPGTPQFPQHVPLVVIVSGPAGAGKTSLVNALLANSSQFMRAITCTCRPPRPGEINGVDYHFLTAEEFQRKWKAGEFLENAKVYGYDYGMPSQNVSDALREGKDLAINIDVQGAATIRRRAREMTLDSLGSTVAKRASLSELIVSVFIMPASMTILESRLKKRGTDDEATIKRRLAAVREEMHRWFEYDYVIVSGALSEDLQRLQGIIAAERMRTKRLELLVQHG